MPQEAAVPSQASLDDMIDTRIDAPMTSEAIEKMHKESQEALDELEKDMGISEYSKANSSAAALNSFRKVVPSVTPQLQEAHPELLDAVKQLRDDQSATWSRMQIHADNSEAMISDYRRDLRNCQRSLQKAKETHEKQLSAFDKCMSSHADMLQKQEASMAEHKEATSNIIREHKEYADYLVRKQQHADDKMNRAVDAVQRFFSNALAGNPPSPPLRLPRILEYQ